MGYYEIKTERGQGDKVWVIQHQNVLEKCSCCKGIGKIEVYKCPKCYGEGKVSVRSLWVSIGQYKIISVTVKWSRRSYFESYDVERTKQSQSCSAFLPIRNEDIFDTNKDAKTECDKRNKKERKHE